MGRKDVGDRWEPLERRQGHQRLIAYLHGGPRQKGTTVVLLRGVWSYGEVDVAAEVQ